jgi:PHD/YefM family antitoxin component YafN of YafNO toxin-antitoxin module
MGHNYGTISPQNGVDIMPQIIPIRDLKKTSELSEICRNAQEPVFITKNGYGDMVIMSMETYEKTMFLNDIYRKLEEGEQSIRAGDVMDGFDSLKAIREKHGL